MEKERLTRNPPRSGRGLRDDGAAKAALSEASAARVLVVDDEEAIADLVVQLLASEGIAAHACYDAPSALALFAELPFELVILDVMMPVMDGFELCRRLRAVADDVSVMFLSARDEEIDQVVGFSLGADDYVGKPFKPRELVARVKARLRRVARTRAAGEGALAGTGGGRLLEARGIEVDEGAHRAFVHGEAMSLTPKEFSILALLVARAGTPVSTREIFESVWGERYDASAANTVMVHIRHVRKKLAAVDSATTFIETAWGVGYVIAAERRKNELVAYVAHDVKTPPTLVIGHFSILDEAKDLPAASRERYISVVLEKAERLESLVDELFEIARYNVQAIPVERAEVDVRLFCEQVAEEFYPDAQARSASIRVDAPEGKTFFVDAEKLARALGNVVRNALAYADAGTDVDIRAREGDDGSWIVAVANRGREISAAHLESIFEKFYRVDAARTTRSGGAGLGLAIAREIVEAHGGSIEARSEAGVTTFTLTIR